MIFFFLIYKKRMSPLKKLIIKKNVILNRANDYYKMIKKYLESKQEINTETYMKKKKKKMKSENMEETATTKSQKK